MPVTTLHPLVLGARDIGAGIGRGQFQIDDATDSCGGTTERVGESPRSDGNAVAAWLTSSQRYGGMIASASQIGTSGIIIVKLTEKFDFREDEAKGTIDRDPALAGRVAYTEYDGQVAVVGEVVMIMETSYPGYSGR